MLDDAQSLRLVAFICPLFCGLGWRRFSGGVAVAGPFLTLNMKIDPVFITFLGV